MFAPRQIVAGFCALAIFGALQVTSIPVFSDAGLGGVQSAFAQKEKKEKPNTKRSDTVSKKVGEKLNEAQEYMATDQWSAAMGILNRLSQDTKLKPYEQAVIWRMIGNVHAQQENYTQSLAAFERAFRLKALPESDQLDLQFFIGQLYLAEERYDEAISTLEAWLRASGDGAAPAAYFVLAQAYTIKENYSRALSYAQTGMTKARAADDKRKSWWSLTTNLYLQAQKYKEAQNLLREMVVLWPGIKSYWNQLGATYSLLNDEDNAYYFKLMMYAQNMLSKSNELEQLANVNLYYEVPHRSTRVLKKGFADGIVDRNADNYELYATAYQESREWEKSIEPLTQAAKLSSDGDLYMRLCQSYLFDQKYSKAESACVNAINKGSLKDAGNTWMLLGTARYSNDKRDTALAAFKNAVKYEKVQRGAGQWIKFIETEIKNDEARAAYNAELQKRADEEAARLQGN
jgi:tetratricopeptide (TPR) repeat protein